MAVAALLAQTHYVYRFILKGFDIQRQQAGILRDGAEGIQNRKWAHTYALQRFFRPWNGDLKMNCGAVHFRPGMGSVEFPSLTEL